MIIGQYNIRPFVVGIQEMPQKTEFILKHFRDVGLGEVEVFNGISATESGVETKWTYDVDNPGTGYKIGGKPTSTFLSFYMLWSAMLYMNDHYWLILEWDAKFDTDWRPRVEQALKDIPPDFDLFYIGNCCCKGKPVQHVKGDLYKMNQMQCGHATIVAKKALPIMLKTQRRIYAPLDVSLAFHTLPLLNCYALLPRAVSQFDTYLPE